MRVLALALVMVEAPNGEHSGPDPPRQFRDIQEDHVLVQVQVQVGPIGTHSLECRTGKKEKMPFLLMPYFGSVW